MSAHHIRVFFIALLMVLTSAATAALKPAPALHATAPDLDAMLPERFGDWARIGLSDAVLPAETELQEGEAVAYRAYRDDIGRTVTLVVAYGPPLGDSVRLHRPEKCYAAQGFEIRNQSQAVITAAGRAVTVVDLDTQSPSRREAVSYWLRDGDGLTGRASDSAWRRLRAGLSRPLDGALVRVSTINAQSPQFDLNRRFLEEFSAALSPDARVLLLGEGAGA